MHIRNEMMHFQIKQSVTPHERIDIQVRHSVISNKRKNFQIKQPTVRFTKGGSVLPLYKIGVLLKTGGAGRFIITRKINVVIQEIFERLNR